MAERLWRPAPVLFREHLITARMFAPVRPKARNVRFGSWAAVLGRLMAQPVYPPASEMPVRFGTYASCQLATSK